MAFMNPINMISDIIMLGIPGLSMENVAHLQKLEVKIFIGSKVMGKKLKLELLGPF